MLVNTVDRKLLSSQPKYKQRAFWEQATSAFKKEIAYSLAYSHAVWPLSHALQECPREGCSSSPASSRHWLTLLGTVVTG